MYGLYIKGRGWVKTILNDNKVKCCRNGSDLHANFLFNNVAECKAIINFYLEAFEPVDVEFKEIPEDVLIDKRVMPSKKGGRQDKERFILKSKMVSYSNKYCKFCGLFIDKREYIADGVCIHCMEVFRDILKPHYDAMGDEIKDAWVRAKILDEI